jgi:hypothetical protein
LHDDLANAARLLAAAFQQFKSLSPFLAPADQAEYEQLRTQLGERMDAAELQMAWASGEVMSAAEAMELALHLAEN